MQRARQAATRAREFNANVTSDDVEQYKLGGMKALAKEFFDLTTPASKKAFFDNLTAIKITGDLLIGYDDQQLKKTKLKLMSRHLQLLEAKHKALETAVRNARSPAELGEYVRGVLFPQSNGHKPAKEAILIENGVAS